MFDPEAQAWSTKTPMPEAWECVMDNCQILLLPLPLRLEVLQGARYG